MRIILEIEVDATMWETTHGLSQGSDIAEHVRSVVAAAVATHTLHHGRVRTVGVAQPTDDTTTTERL